MKRGHAAGRHECHNKEYIAESQLHGVLYTHADNNCFDYRPKSPDDPATTWNGKSPGRKREPPKLTKAEKRARQMRGKASKLKGKNAEREFGKLCEGYLGGSVRRTPCSGGLDMKGDLRPMGNILSDFSLEVKRQEKWSVPAWIRQAEADAGGKPWVLAMRRNKEPWRVVMDAEDWLRLMSELQERRGG